MHRFQHVFMPYCLQRQEGSRYAVLNRDRKPLGLSQGYCTHFPVRPPLVTLRRLSGDVAALLSWKGDPNLENIYLYAQDSPPTTSPGYMKSYLRRLAVLAMLEVDVGGAPMSEIMGWANLAKGYDPDERH